MTSFPSNFFRIIFPDTYLPLIVALRARCEAVTGNTFDCDQGNGALLWNAQTRHLKVRAIRI